MVAAAIADRSLGLAHTSRDELAPGEKYLKIISAFRSREYQEKLRRQSPNAGRAGLAVNSPHFTGRALDLYVGGDPVDTRDANRAFQIQTGDGGRGPHKRCRFAKGRDCCRPHDSDVGG